MEKTQTITITKTVIIGAHGLGFFHFVASWAAMALYFWFQLKFSTSKCDFPVIFCIHLCYKKSGSIVRREKG